MAEIPLSDSEHLELRPELRRSREQLIPTADILKMIGCRDTLLLALAAIEGQQLTDEERAVAKAGVACILVQRDDGCDMTQEMDIWIFG